MNDILNYKKTIWQGNLNFIVLRRSKRTYLSRWKQFISNTESKTVMKILILNQKLWICILQGNVLIVHIW